MELSSEAAAKLIRDQANKDLLAKAIRHEERVRFHSLLVECEAEASSYLAAYKKYIKSLLPKDKYKRFITRLQFPLPTTELVDVIFSELSKVFDAQNKHLSYQFTSPEQKADFVAYLEWMEFSQFWENDCFEAIRNKVNCIQVVDMPITTEGKPEPYVYNLAIERVLAIQISDDGNINFVAFRDKDRVIAIDDNYYRTYSIENDDLESISLISENRHFLGYAPARFLMTDNIGVTKLVKQSPISKALFAFDLLLFRIISGENLEDYASYPIYSVYDNGCDYVDHNNNRCMSGKINAVDSYGNEYVHDCPVCMENYYVGPGSVLTSKTPRTKDQPDLLKQVNITPADTESLTFVQGSIDRRKSAILNSCVGSDKEQLTGQAQNELQVLSTYDTKQAILMKLKRNIEKAKKFVIDTMGKLRYGDAYIGCTVDEGSKFYLATSQQLNEKLKQAIENGGSMFEIEMIKDEIYSNEYRNNPEQLERRDILKRLEPYYLLSIDQVRELNAISPIDQNILNLKYNFAYFVSKFEDENGSVTEFGSLLPLRKRIEIIKKQLLNYVKEEFSISTGGGNTGG